MNWAEIIAREVWMVFETGTVRFFGPESERARSVFPTDPRSLLNP